jgi:hypothetical protein
VQISDWFIVLATEQPKAAGTQIVTGLLIAPELQRKGHKAELDWPSRHSSKESTGALEVSSPYPYIPISHQGEI